jgi:lipoic acid synthetase
MLEVRWLSKVTYPEALDLQHRLMEHSTNNYLLLLEHPHVYTMGVRAKRENILVDPASVGATVVEVDRGGDVTYHGPGQLVGYFIVDVDSNSNAIPRFVNRIEETIINTLATFGVTAFRNEGYPGVWVNSIHGDLRKIAAIGVRVTRGRSMHGFALNVASDMEMFGHIIPCGISEYQVTSMAEEGVNVELEDVVARVASIAPDIFEFDKSNFYGTSSREGYYEVAVEDNSRSQVKRVAPLEVAGDRTMDRRLASAGVDASTAVTLRSRKPDWLRMNAKMGDDFNDIRSTMRSLSLVTVCEEAGCPNIFECWSEGTATFMINGEDCTRSCSFCLVKTDKPLPIDPEEAGRVAIAVDEMNLDFAVVTAVARDDLSDGGATAFANTIKAIKERRNGCQVEVLIPDCKGDIDSQRIIFDAWPEVLNHNIETVLRLQRAVRPQASYARSLTVLTRAANHGLVTKSGIIVGLGETIDEVKATMRDLRSVGVSILTVGQYLRPTKKHAAVARWYLPREFAEIRDYGYELGFSHVESSPNTRSSYHAKSASDSSRLTSVE